MNPCGFSGDGTGAGKTMTAAGVIYLNSIAIDRPEAHRNVSVFVTKNLPLCRNVEKEINFLSESITTIILNSHPGKKVKSAMKNNTPTCFILSYNTISKGIAVFNELKKYLGTHFTGVVRFLKSASQLLFL